MCSSNLLPDFGPDIVVLAPAKYVLVRDGLIGTVVLVGHNQVTDVLKKRLKTVSTSELEAKKIAHFVKNQLTI